MSEFVDRFPRSLIEFLGRFATEAACAKCLFEAALARRVCLPRLRWRSRLGNERSRSARRSLRSSLRRLTGL
jgi:hypothetical protein